MPFNELLIFLDEIETNIISHIQTVELLVDLRIHCFQKQEFVKKSLIFNF